MMKSITLKQIRVVSKNNPKEYSYEYEVLATTNLLHPRIGDQLVEEAVRGYLRGKGSQAYKAGVQIIIIGDNPCLTSRN